MYSLRQVGYQELVCPATCIENIPHREKKPARYMPVLTLRGEKEQPLLIPNPGSRRGVSGPCTYAQL